MKVKIVLRPITKDDLSWARKIRNENRQYFIYNKLISEEEQKKWFETLSYPFFIITIGAEKIGTIAVEEVHGRLEVHNAVIEETYRRKGVLREALSLLEKKFKKELYIEVLKDNKRAIDAYKKLGFSVVSYRMKKQ